MTERESTIRPIAGSRLVAPRGRRRRDLEATISRLLREAAGKDAVDAHVNLFEQGITSFHIVSAVSELEKSLKREIQVIELMKNPTIAAFAATLVDEDLDAQNAMELSERMGRGARRRALLQQRSTKP